MNSRLKKIFKKGSKTYFNSSIFFPKSVREDVFKLYGFVRVADDFVDAVPQKADEFYAFRKKYEEDLKIGKSEDFIIDSFLEISARLDFDPAWAEAFLDSMEMDLKKSVYETLDEMLLYIYGSAEVIGLFMAKILRLSPQSYVSAKMLGRSMQTINFIRDIAEDLTFQRTYLPCSEFGLKDLSLSSADQSPEAFLQCMNHHLNLYKEWQKTAEEGYRFIPKRYLIPIKTASDMYNWTARSIEKNPFIVFKRKVKPQKLRIFKQILKNALFIKSDKKRGLK